MKKEFQWELKMNYQETLKQLTACQTKIKELQALHKTLQKDLLKGSNEYNQALAHNNDQLRKAQQLQRLLQTEIKQQNQHQNDDRHCGPRAATPTAQALQDHQAHIDALAQLDTTANQNTLARQQQLQAQLQTLAQDSLQTQLHTQLTTISKALDTMQALGSGFQELYNSMGKDNEAMAAFGKMMALFQIGISTAEALAKATASAKGITPIDYALQVGTNIALVLANMAKANKLIHATKAPKAPQLATGGIVQGTGTGTSDSVNAWLSTGESVLTAQATALFTPILSAFNQLGGGVPINTQHTAQQVLGENMLTAAFATALQHMPPPVVSVQEVSRVTNRVQLLEASTRQ